MSVVTGERNMPQRLHFAVELGTEPCIPETMIIDTIAGMCRQIGIDTHTEDDVMSIIRGRLIKDESTLIAVKQLASNSELCTTEADIIPIAHGLLDNFEKRGYAHAYVDHRISRILNGKKFNMHHAERIDKFKQELSVRGDHATGFHVAANSKIIRAVGTILDRGTPAQLQQMAKLNNQARIGADHPNVTATSLAVDLMLKIESSIEFTDHDFDEIAKYANMPVPPAIRRQFIEATKRNHDRVAGQAARRALRLKEKLDVPKLQKYAAILTALSVDKAIVQRLASTSGEADVVFDHLSQENATITVVSAVDESKGTFTVTEVTAEPKTGKWQSPHLNKIGTVMFAATILATGQKAGIVDLIPTHSAPQVPNATAATKPKTPPATAKTPVTTAPAEVPAAAAPAQPVPEAAVPAATPIPLPAVDGETLQQLSAQTSGDTHQQKATPASTSSRPEVKIGSKATAHAIEVPASTAAVSESWKRALVSGNLEQATAAITAHFIPAGQEVLTTDTDFINRVNTETDAMDQVAIGYYQAGKIDENTFLRSREKAAYARFESRYAGQEAILGIDPASLHSDFVDAYIQTHLSKAPVLGADAETTHPLVSLLVASAAEVIAPKSAQDGVIERAANQQNVSVETDDSPTAKPQPPDAKQTTSETNSNQEAAVDGIVLRDSALKAMAEKGVEWKNRALFAQVLIDGGLRPVGAAGFIGNACIEAKQSSEDYYCGMVPGTHQEGGSAAGEMQWEGGRLDALKQFAADNDLEWDTVLAQGLFTLHELRSSESATMDALKAVDTPEEAAMVVLYKFERPANPEASKDKRAFYARQTYDVYQKLSGEQSSDETSQGPEVKGDYFPSASDIQKYLDDKYGTETGHLGPEDLETIGDNWGGLQLYPAAAESFRLMDQAFYDEFGKHLDLTDAYRSYDAQVQCKKDKPTQCAEPGTSIHGNGAAIDVGSNADVYDTPENDWLVKNAHLFGWTNPYWASKDCVETDEQDCKTEPWHKEYTGGVRIDIDKILRQLAAEKADRDKQPGTIDKELLISEEGYAFPVPLESASIVTQPWGKQNVSGGVHPGMDFGVPVGTQLTPIAPGKVIAAGFSSQTGGADPDGAGNYVIILDENDRRNIYEHLSEVHVKVGDEVTYKTDLALSGATGNVQSSSGGDGAHLHIQIQKPGVEEFVGRNTPDALEKTIDPATVLPKSDTLAEFVKKLVSRAVAPVPAAAEAAPPAPAPSLLEQRLGALATTVPDPTGLVAGVVDGVLGTTTPSPTGQPVPADNTASDSSN